MENLIFNDTQMYIFGVLLIMYVLTLMTDKAFGFMLISVMCLSMIIFTVSSVTIDLIYIVQCLLFASIIVWNSEKRKIIATEED
jgi:hypothetical protein